MPFIPAMMSVLTIAVSEYQQFRYTPVTAHAGQVGIFVGAAEPAREDNSDFRFYRVSPSFASRPPSHDRPPIVVPYQTGAFDHAAGKAYGRFVTSVVPVGKHLYIMPLGGRHTAVPLDDVQCLEDSEWGMTRRPAEAADDKIPSSCGVPFGPAPDLFPPKHRLGGQRSEAVGLPRLPPDLPPLPAYGFAPIGDGYGVVVEVNAGRVATATIPLFPLDIQAKLYPDAQARRPLRRAGLMPESYYGEPFVVRRAGDLVYLLTTSGLLIRVAPSGPDELTTNIVSAGPNARFIGLIDVPQDNLLYAFDADAARAGIPVPKDNPFGQPEDTDLYAFGRRLGSPLDERFVVKLSEKSMPLPYLRHPTSTVIPAAEVIDCLSAITRKPGP